MRETKQDRASARRRRAWHDAYDVFEDQIGPLVPSVRATARRILGDDDAAADAVQEALISLWQAGPLPDHLRRWLLRTVVHRSLHARRSNVRRAQWEDRGGEAVAPCAMCDPLRQVEVHELLEVLDRALEMLSPDQREVIELRDIDGLEYREIASRLGVPVGTVRSRLNRARARVRESADRMMAGL
jgi:RNA polymerase sigma-70 factor (ECF subfamily)